MASAASVVTGAVKSLHSRLWGAEPTQVAKSGPRSAYLDIFDSLRVHIDHYDIDPNPANYVLLYRYYVRGEANLAEAVSKLIETGYAPDG